MWLRERGRDVLLAGVTVGMVLWSASSACTFPTSAPSPICVVKDSDPDCIGFRVTVTGDRSFGVNFGFSSVGGGAGAPAVLEVGLRPGTYAGSGTMTATTLAFWLQTVGPLTNGGVQSNYVQMVSGPRGTIPSWCQVTYSTGGAPPTGESYRFTFTVGKPAPYC